MLHEAQQLDQFTRPVDVLICGGGTVGLFMGVLLARSGLQVIVLERGEGVAIPNGEADGSRSVGRPHFGHQHGRAFGLGGTSALWGGQLAEFDPEDFAGWPLDYGDVAPWYAQAYRHLGLGEPLTPDALRATVGGEQAVADTTIERFFTLWLDQPNIASLFADDIRSNVHLHVFRGARVYDLTTDAQQVTHVEVAAGDTRWSIPARSVVLAAGTIETSRILLNCGKRTDAGWVGNDRIGCLFQDHLGGKVASVTPIDERRLRDMFENGRAGGCRFQPKLRYASGRRAADGLGIAGMLTYESSIGESLVNLKQAIRAVAHGTRFSGLKTLPRDVVKVGRSFVPLTLRYLRDRRVMAMWDKSLDYTVQTEQRPLSTSRITLVTGTRDTHGWAQAQIDWRVDGGELAAIKRFVLASDNWLQAQGIARLTPFDALLDEDPALLDTLADTYHQAGGACMSEHRGEGVTDRDCRVWGTSNLYIAGAAVFPTSSHANVTLTALALAARLAERLKGDGK